MSTPIMSTFENVNSQMSTHHFFDNHSDYLAKYLLNHLMYQRSSLSHIGFLSYRYLRIRARKEGNETAAIAFFAFVAWDGVMEELEEIDELADFKEYFQSYMDERTVSTGYVEFL